MLIKKFGEKKQRVPFLYLQETKRKIKRKLERKIIVDFAMRYGNPSIKSNLNYLKNRV
jgi:protoheme ferro-lyase